MTEIIYMVLPALLIGSGIFYWLSQREKRRVADGQPRLAPWRLVFAALFGLVALFSGGCSLFFSLDALKSNPYVTFPAIMIVGGIPFVISIFLWWLSMRRGKS